MFFLHSLDVCGVDCSVYCCGYSVHITGNTYTAAKFDLLARNVIYPQISHSELTAGVITDTLIYFACIFMQK